MASEPTESELAALFQLFNAKRLDQAIGEVERLLVAYPEAAILPFLNGVALAGLGKFEPAVACYRRALELKPDYLQAWNDLAHVLFELKQSDEAVASYRSLLAIKPDDGNAWLNLGNMLRKLGRFDEAVAAFQSVLTIDPNNIIALNGMGIVQSQRRNLSEALSCFQKLAALAPTRADAFSNAAIILQQRGQNDEALRHFQRAAELDPNDPAKLASLADAFVLKGRREEAIACCRTLVGRKLTTPSALTLVRTLGALDGLGASPLVPIRIVRNERPFAISSADDFARTTDNPTLQPGDTVPGGTLVTDYTSGTKERTRSYVGLSSAIFRMRDWEVLHPDLMLSSNTLIDSGNGYGTLEIVGHSRNESTLRVAGGGGALTFQIVESGPRVEIDEAVGILIAQENYSSWLLGELPRALAFQSVAPGRKLMLCGEAKSFQLDSLVACGIDRNAIIQVGANANAYGNELIYITPTYFHHTVHLASVAALRERMLAGLKPDPTYGRSIYVSRSALGPHSDRYLKNELDVERYLASKGFEIIHPQKLSFADQARTFAEARRIVAPFGAALAGSIFCDARVKACIIRTKFTPEFDRLFQWLGIDLAHTTARDSMVDIGHLEQFVADSEKADA